MRKSECVNLLERRIGCRATRLTNLVQRASEGGLLRTNAERRPDFDLEPVELARMLLIAVVDEGLGCVPRTIEKYGGLLGPSATLEEVLGHALSRPASFAPSCTGLEVHTGESPHAVLTTVSADGARTLVFGSTSETETETVDRLVTISGAALFAIASEIAGASAADVDKLLAGAGQVQPRSEAA